MQSQIINKFIENIKGSDIIDDDTVKEFVGRKDKEGFGGREEIIEVLRKGGKDGKTSED